VQGNRAVCVGDFDVRHVARLGVDAVVKREVFAHADGLVDDLAHRRGGNEVHLAQRRGGSVHRRRRAEGVANFHLHGVLLGVNQVDVVFRQGEGEGSRHAGLTGGQRGVAVGEVLQDDGAAAAQADEAVLEGVRAAAAGDGRAPREHIAHIAAGNILPRGEVHRA